MAKKFRVTHSDDAMTVHIAGNKANPEPATVVVKFPGGFIEVSRCTDGGYWAHFQRNLESNEDVGEVAGAITESRIDKTLEAWRANPTIPQIPAHADVQHIAVKIVRADHGK